MEKLIHERLREYDERSCSFICDNGRSVMGLWNSEANSLADEIEKYYIPRPRFENGEPVQFGDEVEYGTIHEIAFWDDGTIILLDETPETIYEVSAGCFIKRPEPKVLDADGIEIKVGDTVFENNSPIPLKVVTVYGDGDICAVGDRGICSKLDSSNYSHREPDSLEKILDDLTAYRENQVANNDTLIKIEFRLAAIMERDV